MQPGLPLPKEGPGPVKMQDGFALFLVFLVLLITVLTGNLTLEFIKKDFRHSDRVLQKTKADYAAEAGVYWGMYIARMAPAFSRATHDSTGNNAVISSDSAYITLNDSIALFPGKALSRTEGWIFIEPGDASLTGDPNEKIGCKIWYPTDSTVHVLARVLVPSDTLAEVMLFGDR